MAPRNTASAVFRVNIAGADTATRELRRVQGALNDLSKASDKAAKSRSLMASGVGVAAASPGGSRSGSSIRSGGYSPADLADYAKKNAAITAAQSKLNEAASMSSKEFDFKGLAGAYTAILVAKYIAQGMAHIIAPALEVSNAMTQLQSATGANKEELDAYSKAASHAALITKYNSSESLNALTRLRLASGSSEAAIGLLDSTLQLAQVSMGRLAPEEAAERVGKLVTAFGMTVKEGRLAVDQMIAMGKSAGVMPDVISKIVGKLSQAQEMGGQKFSTILSMATLGLRGMPAEQTGTKLIRTLQHLGSKKSSDALRGLGIDVMDKATGKMRDMSTVLSELSTRDPVAVRGALRQAFDIRSVDLMLTMMSQLRGSFRTATGEIKQGAEVFKYLKSEQEKAAGAGARASIAFMESTGGKLDVLSAAWYEFRKALGEHLLPVLGAVAQGLTALLNTLASIASSPFFEYFVRGALRLGQVVVTIWAVRLAWSGLVKIKGATVAFMDAAAAGATKAGVGLGFFGRMAGRAKWAVKGLIGSTGIGLALAFLPELLQWVGALPDPAKQLRADEERIRKEAEQTQKEFDLRTESAETLYHYLQLGTKEMNETLDRITGVGKFKLAGVDASEITKARSYLTGIAAQRAAAVKGGPSALMEDRDYLMAQTGLAELAALGDILRKGTLASPEEAKRALGSASTVSANLQALAFARTTEKGFDQIIDPFIKKVIDPMHHNLTSTGAGDFVNALMMSAGGISMAKNQELLTGFQPRLGVSTSNPRMFSQWQESMLTRSMTPAEGGTMGAAPTSPGLMAKHQKKLAEWLNTAEGAQTSVGAFSNQQLAWVATMKEVMEKAMKDNARIKMEEERTKAAKETAASLKGMKHFAFAAPGVYVRSDPGGKSARDDEGS